MVSPCVSQRGEALLFSQHPFPKPQARCTSCPWAQRSVQLLSLVCTSKGSEVIGTLGRSITFYLQRLEGEAAAWSFHNDVIVTVKFGDPPEATFFDDNYKPRLAFPNNGSALTISQLRMEDAGTYTAKSSGVKTTFTLHIYRELSVPTVTCMVQNCSASICRYILHCTTSGSSSGNVSYIWSMGSLRKHGATMLVEESLLDEPLLTCTVQNPVSSSNITIISLTALCADNYSSRQAGIVAAAVAGAGVLLAAVILVIYCKPKGWRIFRLPADEAVNTEARSEYTTVYAQVGPSQQPFPQVYLQDGSKTTPMPSSETSKTTHFTIQGTAQEAVDGAERGRKTLQKGKQQWKAPAPVRQRRMKPRGMGMGWLCMAVLCSGAALVIKEDSGHQSPMQRDEGLELLTDPNTTTGDMDKLMTWPTASPTPPWSRDPITTTVLTQTDAAGNKTRNASAVPIKYWSPALFVVVALLVLFFTYQWTKGEGTRDRATSINDSSDLGALDHTSTPKTAAPQEERKDPEKSPALEHTETTFSEPDPTPDPQPDSPAATSGPHCSQEPSAD
ncbi:SLAM family member 5-like isoform X3 [Strigops habroptila]|uniref:SLAM family member 5-like isoform X3 n=1 Tax=Strigops habroptila TaxID=2489341 RepID=UPI0011D00F9D|nr:SLAM family member 5-like isoform X3 [Strigops habroptila]